MQISIGVKLRKGILGRFKKEENISLDWSLLKRHIRFHGLSSAEPEVIQVVLKMISGILGEGGRVVIVDPLLGAKHGQKMCDFWAVIKHAYPEMSTITDMAQIHLLTRMLGNSPDTGQSRVIFVDNLGPEDDGTSNSWLPNADVALSLIHSEAGRRLGRNISDGDQAVTNLELPLLVIVRHVDTRTRKCGLYHGHFTGANIAIVDLKESAEGGFWDNDVDMPRTVIASDFNGSIMKTLQPTLAGYDVVAEQEFELCAKAGRQDIPWPLVEQAHEWDHVVQFSQQYRSRRHSDSDASRTLSVFSI